jgi:hypothetical protein
MAVATYAENVPQPDVSKVAAMGRSRASRRLVNLNRPQHDEAAD